jgi:nucleoside-diphosphate-sugar epimerase
MITEQTPLESEPELRGGYTFAKCKAEEVALANLGNVDVAWTILRPSILFGDGRPVYGLLTGALIGNFFVCFGGSRHYLRLVHADDVGDAVISSLEKEGSKGMVFNVSHPDPFTIGQYFRQVKPTEFGKRIWVLYIPKFVMGTASLILEISRKIFKNGPSISQRQIAYWYCGCRIDAQLIQTKLGWQPKVGNIEKTF